MYSLSQVLNQQFSFMYPDTDGNWTGASRNQIDLYVYGQNNMEICTPSSRIYVGEPFTSFVRVWIYGQYSSGSGVNPTYLLSNAQLKIYDETLNTQILNETILTGVKLVLINLSSSYNATATYPNYTIRQWCYNDEGSCIRQDGSIAYFTKSKYGVDTLELILYPFGAIGNATVTFFVSDANNTPIEGALVHASLGGQSSLTNGVGVSTFSNLINGTYARYTVSKTGWSSAEANYEIYDGEYIHVILYPVTPQPTATIPTPTSTTTPTTYDPFGIILDLIASFSFGERIILGGVIMLACALLIGAKTGSYGALVGAGIGFLINVGLDIFPFWLVIASIVIFGIIFAMKIMNTTGE
jgi:hypothetical protein